MEKNTTEGDKEELKLSFAGNLKLGGIERIREKLVIGLNTNGTKSMLVEILDADNIDLATIQLMISAKKYAEMRGIRFATTFTLAEEQEKLLDRCGLKG